MARDTRERAAGAAADAFMSVLLQSRSRCSEKALLSKLIETNSSGEQFLFPNLVSSPHQMRESLDPLHRHHVPSIQ